MRVKIRPTSRGIGYQVVASDSGHVLHESPTSTIAAAWCRSKEHVIERTDQ